MDRLFEANRDVERRFPWISIPSKGTGLLAYESNLADATNFHSTSTD